MIPWAMFFASGNAFYWGMAFVAISYVLALRGVGRGEPRKSRWMTIFLACGVVFAIASSTPTSATLNGLLVASMLPLLIAVVAGTNSRFRPGRRLLQVGLVTFLISAVVASVVELQASRWQWPAQATDAPIFVIGDSLSAANTDARIRPWPDLLHDAGADVTNLANVGATARSALKQIQRIPEGPCVIIFLIGGNDILGTTTVAQFDADLETLLKALQAPGRTLVLCDLPLPPFGYGFGAAIRKNAAAANAILVSKRMLSAIFAAPGDTVDGIHLSPRGHAALAAKMAKSLPPLAGAGARLP